jgi:hypothetical protein
MRSVVEDSLEQNGKAGFPNIPQPFSQERGHRNIPDTFVHKDAPMGAAAFQPSIMLNGLFKSTFLFEVGLIVFVIGQ